MLSVRRPQGANYIEEGQCVRCIAIASLGATGVLENLNTFPSSKKTPDYRILTHGTALYDILITSLVACQLCAEKASRALTCEVLATILIFVSDLAKPQQIVLPQE